MKSYVLGVDPSISATGIALIEVPTMKIVECITIPTKKQHDTRPDIDIIRRINIIALSLTEFILKHKDKKIYVAGIESPAFAAKGHILQLGGVYYSLLRLMVSTIGQEIIIVPPTSNKFMITGKGRAEKHDMTAGLSKLGIDISETKNDNEIDAVGVAITALLATQHASKEALAINLSKEQIKSLEKLI